MIFLPMFLSFQTAVLICQLIACVSLLILAVKYFKFIDWKLLLPVLIASIIVTGIVAMTSFSFNSTMLTLILAVMLILLSVWFFVFSSRIKIKPTVLNGTILGGIAGIGSGLFAICGPAVVLYLLPAAKRKESYLANIQFYFLIINLIGIAIRLSKGALSTTHIPLILWGWLGIALGTLLGIQTFKRIPLEKLKKAVYAFVGLSGLWLIISTLWSFSF